VTGLLDRAAAWFVTPLGSAPPAPDPEPPLRVAREDELVDLAALGYADGRFAPPVAAEAQARVSAMGRVASRAVVLGAPGEVAVAAAALALALRRRCRTGAAVVVLCGAEAAPALAATTLAAPGLPGARRLAARLARRDLPASAHGRLVWAALTSAADEAGAAATRIAAAAGDAPVVLALLGPRSAAADALLAAHDAALLADDPGSALADLAVADLGGLGLAVHCWPPPAAGAARVAALAGWRAPAGVPDLAAT
jgi:hypothetical protein